MYKNIFYTAQYDCDAYGASAYNECSTSTGGNTNGNAGNGLAGTGYDIIIPVSLGLALLVAGGILLAKRLFRRRQNDNV